MLLKVVIYYSISDEDLYCPYDFPFCFYSFLDMERYFEITYPNLSVDFILEDDGDDSPAVINNIDTVTIR